MDIILIDNHDSFAFNIVHYLRQAGAVVDIYRNNEISIDEINTFSPDALVISPGPGRPENAGISMEIIKAFSGKIPILGICLGHQVIGKYFGANIIHAKKVMHGKTSMISSNGQNIFKGIKKPFQAMRYHSLAIDEKTIPASLEITAVSEDGQIMGIQHKSHNTCGVQFHPESIMTSVGKRLIRNFCTQV